MSDNTTTGDAPAKKQKKTRRGHNEGSIYQVKSGSQKGMWRGSVSLKVNGRTKRKYVSGKDRAEVNRKITRILSDPQTAVAAERMPTVAVYLDQWLEEVIKPGRRPGTYSVYAAVVTNHINPHIGDLRLDRIEASDVRRLINAKKTEGLGQSRLRTIRAVLSTALNQAIEDNLKVHNVAKVKLPKFEEGDPGAPTKGNPLTAAEATALLKAAKDDRLEAFLTVALFLGLRHGELRGLRWQDVDFEQREVAISVQMQRDAATGKPALVPLKTASSRATLPMPGPVYDALTKRRRQYAKDRLLAGGRWRNDFDLVFCTSIGTPLDPDKTRAQFRSVLTAAGVKHVRIHDLRHSTASLLVARNVPHKMVQVILRHASITTTMDRYAKVETATTRTALETLDDLAAG